MATSNTHRKMRSAHQPRVRDGLCRHIRAKGMLVNIGEKAEHELARRMREADPNALPSDTTIWWCDQTSKVIGPDDKPCHRDECGGSDRVRYEAEDELPVA